jgi:hypothetical protein
LFEGIGRELGECRPYLFSLSVVLKLDDHEHRAFERRIVARFVRGSPGRVIRSRALYAGAIFITSCRYKNSSPVDAVFLHKMLNRHLCIAARVEFTFKFDSHTHAPFMFFSLINFCEKISLGFKRYAGLGVPPVQNLATKKVS